MNMNNVESVFKKYVEALATQSWDACESFFHDDATVVFTEGTYIGKPEVAMAIGRTFSIIREESFVTKKLHWTIDTAAFATCTFEYVWAGTINGNRFTNPGRGTLVWVNTNGKWQIINEHFGPMPR